MTDQTDKPTPPQSYGVVVARKVMTGSTGVRTMVGTLTHTYEITTVPDDRSPARKIWDALIFRFHKGA
jgi:hypothetical protein